jgi:endonuclease/exonuclease/phosphatase family metal-dependent hydrolase
MNERASQIARLAEVVEATAVFVCFYQALRVLFSVLFGMIYDALFAASGPMTGVGVAVLLVLLALVAPLAAPRRPHPRRMARLAGAVLVFLARIPLTLNDPQTRLVASLLIVAAAGLYLAARLQDGPRDMARALLLALVVDQLLRAAGHTWDVTLRPAWWPGQIAVSLGLCLLAGWLSRKQPAAEAATVPHVGLLAGLAWGSWLFLETSLLNYPNALARWSGVPYAAAAPLLLAVTLLPLLLNGPFLATLRRLQAAAELVLFLLCLAGGRLLSGPVALLLLLAAQWIALRFLFAFFSPHQSGQARHLRSGLALGGVAFLIFSFAYAFAFTYPYTLDLFHNMGLPILLVAGLFAALPGLRPAGRKEAVPPPPRAILLAGWASGAALVLLVLLLAWPRQRPQASPGQQLLTGGQSLRFVTYNVHYGYDTWWHLSLEEEAQAIEAAGADVVMLQEVDTGRPTSYMIDDALWLSRRLGMEAVYLPTVEALTGIALLSRAPIADSETLLLPSELEQTGIIRAELDLDGRPVQAFATWLGLEPQERARQVDAALPFMATHPGPAAFGGDLNSDPDSPVYERIAAAGFVDPFPALGLGSPPTSPALDPGRRIDFVWLRDLAPVKARVLESTASDHRPVVVEAGLP